ncbi:hypothetical protein NP233_g1060 [Leucocoprinus birnbaumii]|uniref:Protein F37C4.5 n=1 Tax=Leucocoprinus birnbaumii TaxID=56174 RepID=A0AAD5W605_9AGAR|nr:hypothetical protein NP233_g1060 [Leucocoprinus birnbaumii]
MTASKDMPPSFEPTIIDLVSEYDGKINHVSLYSSRAEITRLFRFEVQVGLNQVNISGIPNALDPNSLKVEGTGHAIIHDVTVSDLSTSEQSTTSEKLEELLRRKKKTQHGIHRCNLAIKALETYLGTLNVKDVEVGEVANIVRTYQKTAGNLDDELTQLLDEMKKIDADVDSERQKLTGAVANQQLRKKVTVGLFADSDGEVGIKLIYGVHRASWQAFYDVRVDSMQAQDKKTVELTYKASIVQSTGEDWRDVNLTLETADPVFGIDTLSLATWTISTYRPTTNYYNSRGGGGKRASPAASTLPGTQTATRSIMQEESEFGEPNMTQLEAGINSKNSITATFVVPGKISIPSDGGTHSVTIAQLNLGATMRWIAIPKQEAKTHLSAKIKNASDYSLLSGQASVYVDGSFIARTIVPPVGPEETFDCPLGLDPSIRITYHPRMKKTSRSGFYNKTTSQIYIQRITVFNSKMHSIDNLKVTDQFPISEDSSVTVKQMNPSLADVSREPNAQGEFKMPEKTKISSGVFAQWSGADEPDVNVELLGKDGKFDWICYIPAQGKVDLLLQYEVAAPPRTQITGI